MTIGNLVSAQSYKDPEKIAIKHGEAELTYAQLNKKAAQLACYLQTQGLAADDVVAFALDRSPEMIITFLAFVKAGITYLPVDSAFPIDRVNYMLNDSGARLLLTSKKHADKFRGYSQHYFYRRRPGRSLPFNIH
jgi:non-ribosomal peptide synthetase component F